MPDTPFFDLSARLHEIAVLGSVGALIGWDEQVMMPAGGTALRAEQSAAMAKLVHERATDPSTGDRLLAAEAADLDDDQAVVVREARRDYDRATRLPVTLVAELSRATVLSQAAWTEARAAADFAKFAPWLERVVALKRQEAACLGELSADPYDALLDGFEPGETAASVGPIFDALRPPLVELLGKVAGATRRPRGDVLNRPFPVDAQRTLMKRVIDAVGFDATAGRLDVSVHPFCTGIGPGDTRITTRYGEGDFMGALLGTLHEAGHALYEQGLPKATHFGTALAEATSLGIHESQSRLWENMVGRGRAFNGFLWPGLRDSFGGRLDDASADDWLGAINVIEPSFVRTEADELTYNLHVLLRFELESAIVRGDLAVADLPGAWNERFKALLGLDVPDAARGCLQDVHWSAGLFGYFPTYTLGNLYAAQFYETAVAEMPDLADDFARGDFRRLLAWLRRNIHCHGRRYSARQLCERVTGRSLSAAPLLRRLSGKVEEFYGL